MKEESKKKEKEKDEQPEEGVAKNQ